MILSKSRSDLRKFPSILSALYSNGMQLYQSTNTSTFSSGMSRFGSVGNAKLLVLPVTFYLSEIDNSVPCFCFYVLFIKNTIFSEIFGKLSGRLKPSSYSHCAVPDTSS